MAKRGGRLKVRVLFDPDVVLGPGKADLLEGIRETGSISAAGRRMQMSYKRSWDLIDALNHYFRGPLVQTNTGGVGGGGASLTPLGEEVLALYRRIETRCGDVVTEEMASLRKSLRRQ